MAHDEKNIKNVLEKVSLVIKTITEIRKETEKLKINDLHDDLWISPRVKATFLLLQSKLERELRSI